MVAAGAGTAAGSAASVSTPVASGAAEVWFTPGVILPLAQVEMRAIQHALACEKGNKTRAAQLLGISRQTLRTKLKEHALADDSEDAAE
jgi:DNA-binding NtrC family response regulator